MRDGVKPYDHEIQLMGICQLVPANSLIPDRPSAVGVKSRRFLGIGLVAVLSMR